MLLIKKACIPCLRMCASFMKSSPGLYHHIYSFEFLYLNYFQNIFPIFLNWILFFLAVQKYFFSPMEKSFLLAFQKNFSLFAAWISVSQFWKCFLNFDFFFFRIWSLFSILKIIFQFWKNFLRGMFRLPYMFVFTNSHRSKFCWFKILYQKSNLSYFAANTTQKNLRWYLGG